MSNPKAKTPYKRRSYTQRLLASLTDAGGAGGRLDKDTLSPDDRAAANPYSSPVSGERSRARSSSYYSYAKSTVCNARLILRARPDTLWFRFGL